MRNSCVLLTCTEKIPCCVHAPQCGQGAATQRLSEIQCLVLVQHWRSACLAGLKMAARSLLSVFGTQGKVVAAQLVARWSSQKQQETNIQAQWLSQAKNRIAAGSTVVLESNSWKFKSSIRKCPGERLHGKFIHNLTLSKANRAFNRTPNMLAPFHSASMFSAG